ncbi:MAG: hypothetical protein ABL974_17345, partial [Prosthecobacter sp.]
MGDGLKLPTKHKKLMPTFIQLAVLAFIVAKEGRRQLSCLGLFFKPLLSGLLPGNNRLLKRLVYFLLLSPFYSAIDARGRRVAAKQADLAWLQGSLAEVETQIVIAQRLAYLNQEQTSELSS